MSQALNLLANYESSSEDENDGTLFECEDNQNKNETVNSITSEDESIMEATKITLDFLLSRVSLEVPLNHSKSFLKARSRNEDEIDISSDSASSSTWSLSSSESDDVELITSNKPNLQFLKKRAPKTKGELDFDDLPPIENLRIQVETNELVHIGRVASIVEQLVNVQTFRGQPVLNIDSVLFFKDGTPLGSVFDVFGPVPEPLYAVRFNNSQEITEKKIEISMPVYYAPNYLGSFTDYVFAEQLRRLKGSDASWRHNNEPPEGVKEYSDDEEERRDKQKQRAKTRLMSRPPYQNSTPRNIVNRYQFQAPRVPVPPNTPNTPYRYQFQQPTLPTPNNWFADYPRRFY